VIATSEEYITPIPDTPLSRRRKRAVRVVFTVQDPDPAPASFSLAAFFPRFV
jgi:hypothetical protein